MSEFYVCVRESNQWVQIQIFADFRLERLFEENKIGLARDKILEKNTF
jgi:hypothetical protein